jgi:hypothetical protein
MTFRESGSEIAPRRRGERGVDKLLVKRFFDLCTAIVEIVRKLP